MFSPLNDPRVIEWFRSLDAAWKRMPAEEQTRQREEVQQHLDGLVAAKVASGQTLEDAWNAALMQFGDPGRFGRQMRREASTLGPDPNQWSKNPLAVAWAHCLAVCILAVGGVWAMWMACLCLLWTFAPALSESSPLSRLIGDFFGGGMLATSIFAGWLNGKRMKNHSVAGAFYTFFPFALFDGLLLLLMDHDAVGASYFLAWAGLGCAAAYLASVTKRGWYKPTWEDFKLTWAKRRQRVG